MSPRTRAALARVGGLEGIWSGRRAHQFDEWCWLANCRNHQVLGIGDTAAASLHVYGPALTVMNRYRVDAEHGPIIAVTERAGQDW